MMSPKPTCLCGECELCVRREANKRYRERHPERVRAAGNRYYAENRETVLKKANDYYDENREEIIAKNTAARRADPSKTRKSAREWSAANPEKRYASRIKSAYGLTPEDIERMLEAQDGKCDLCPRVFSEDVQPCIDHCHETGRVRSLLCSRCNLLLGHFERNRHRADDLWAYVDRYKS